MRNFLLSAALVSTIAANTHAQPAMQKVVTTLEKMDQRLVQTEAKLYRLHQAIEELESRQGSKATIEALRAEVDDLRRELKALKANPAPKPNAAPVEIVNNSTEILIIEITDYYIDEFGAKVWETGTWKCNPGKTTSLLEDTSPFRCCEFRYRIKTDHGSTPEVGKVWVAKYEGGPTLTITIDKDDVPSKKSADPKVGSRVYCETKTGFWYPAEVVEIDAPGFVHVRYVGYSNSFNETVHISRIRSTVAGLPSTRVMGPGPSE